MRTLMFSGHCMPPYELDIKSLNDIIYCKESTMLELNIRDKTYLMHYDHESQADINVIGWCLQSFQTAAHAPYPKSPIRGNIAFSSLEGNELSKEDVNEITSYVENKKDHWAENIVLTYTRLSKEFIKSQKSEPVRFDAFFDDVKAILDMYKIMMHALSDRGKIDIEKENKTYYLDLETTGLSFVHDEILSVTIIDEDGIVVLDQLVKPKHKSSWPESEEIHQITPAMVEHMPRIESIMPSIIEIFEKASSVKIYNAKFDMEFLMRRAEKYRKLISEKSNCAMLEFALCYAEHDPIHQSMRWFTLDLAMQMMSIPWIGNQHTSFADAMACRNLSTALCRWLEIINADESAMILQIALKIYSEKELKDAKDFIDENYKNLSISYLSQLNQMRYSLKQDHQLSDDEIKERMLDCTKKSIAAVEEFRERYGR